MIGNDIVDLKLASSSPNWRRKRFIDKVFSVEEQKIISHSSDSFRTIWLLWSMKESAYKIYVRQHSKKFFAPAMVKCNLLTSNDGIVEIFHETYKTNTTIDKNYIYTIAFNDFSENIISNCFELENATYSNQHYTSYQNLLYAIAELENVTATSLVIKKDEFGTPILYRNNHAQNIPLSITHHGHYGGYAILK